MSLTPHEGFRSHRGAAPVLRGLAPVVARYPKTRHARVIVLFLVATLSGCAVASQLNPLAGMGSLWPSTPPAQVVGPDSAFFLRTPPLLTPGARVGAKRIESRVWRATFSDDLCRAYIIMVYTDTSNRSVTEWVHSEARPQFEKKGGVDLVERTDTLENLGAATYVRFRLPKGAPCVVEQIGGGLRLFPKSHRPDAELAHYFFRRGVYVFDVAYGRPIHEVSSAEPDPDRSFGMRVGPVEVMLRELLRGLVFADP